MPGLLQAFRSTPAAKIICRNGLRKQPFLDQGITIVDGVGIVHLQHSDCSTANGSAADENRTIPAKMMRPVVPTRMEQLRDFLCQCVDAREVRAFVVVTVMAGKGQVGGMIAAAVLFGNDVLDVKRREGSECFREKAIFTPIARALPDMLACRDVH